MDSLFEELVTLDLLKKSETVALKDYVGETPHPSVGSQAKARCQGPRPQPSWWPSDTLWSEPSPVWLSFLARLNGSH